jgi:hypothetical protein
MIPSAEDFLKMTAGDEERDVPWKHATIPAGYTSGRPTVQFDGEDSPTIKAYPYLSSYTPTANDRVLVAIVGHGGVILGKIV